MIDYYVRFAEAMDMDYLSKLIISEVLANRHFFLES